MSRTWTRRWTVFILWLTSSKQSDGEDVGRLLWKDEVIESEPSSISLFDVHTLVEWSLVSKKDPQYCVVAFRISLKKLMFFKIYCNDEWRDVTLHCDGDQGNWHRHSSGELLVSLVCYCVGQVWQGGKHRVRGNVTADGKRQASPAIIPRRWQRRAASVSASTIQPQRYLQSQRSHQEHHLVSVRPLGSPLQYPLRLFTLKTFRLTK